MIGDGRDVVVVDLGFGDAGKGATVDWLCAADGGPRPAAVVRYNGGAQAAHHVRTGDGRGHTFHQFGSGTFAGVPTHLSEYMMVDPILLAAEARALSRLGVANPLALLSISPRALLTTPIHAAANRTIEDARGSGRHGSCGLGVGETARYALLHEEMAPRMGDSVSDLTVKLHALQDFYRPLLQTGRHRHPDVEDLVSVYAECTRAVHITQPGWLGELATRGRLIFEGAQGALLDEWRGFHPHTTWSTVTPDNALTLLAEIGRPAYVLGVSRTYLTRHGAGPFPSENSRLQLPEPTNGGGAYQGRFRVGYFDPILLRYALGACGGIDGLALTHLDRLPLLGRAVSEYLTSHGRVRELPVTHERDLANQEQLTSLLNTARPVLQPMPSATSTAMEWISGQLNVPVVLGAAGPNRDDRFVPALAVAA